MYWRLADRDPVDVPRMAWPDPRKPDFIKAEERDLIVQWRKNKAELPAHYLVDFEWSKQLMRHLMSGGAPPPRTITITGPTLFSNDMKTVYEYPVLPTTEDPLPEQNSLEVAPPVPDADAREKYAAGVSFIRDMVASGLLDRDSVQVREWTLISTKTRECPLFGWNPALVARILHSEGAKAQADSRPVSEEQSRSSGCSTHPVVKKEVRVFARSLKTSPSAVIVLDPPSPRVTTMAVVASSPVIASPDRKKHRASEGAPIKSEQQGIKQEAVEAAGPDFLQLPKALSDACKVVVIDVDEEDDSP